VLQKSPSVNIYSRAIAAFYVIEILRDPQVLNCGTAFQLICDKLTLTYSDLSGY